jgi:hypothetical protein
MVVSAKAAVPAARTQPSHMIFLLFDFIDFTSIYKDNVAGR